MVPARAPFDAFKVGAFDLIMADAPWPVEMRSAKGEEKSFAKHYGAMTLADIAALPVGDLAARDCVLFMWGVWPLLLDGVPDDINRIRLRYHEIGSGPAGFVQPDDVEMFDRVGLGLASEEVEWIQMTRGLERETVAADGHKVSHISDETPQRGQYRRWRELMSVGG